MNLIEYINKTFTLDLSIDSVSDTCLKQNLTESQRDLISLHFLNEVSNYLSLRQNSLLYDSFLKSYEVENVFWAQLRFQYSDSPEFFLMMFENGFELDLLNWGFFDNGFDNCEKLFDNPKLNQYIVNFFEKHSEFFTVDFLKDNLRALKYLNILDAFLDKHINRLTKTELVEVLSVDRKAIAERIRQLSLNNLKNTVFNLNFPDERKDDEINPNDVINAAIKERKNELFDLCTDENDQYQFLSNTTKKFSDWRIFTNEEVKQLLNKVSLEVLKDKSNYESPKKRGYGYGNFIWEYIDSRITNSTQQNKKAQEELNKQNLEAKKEQEKNDLLRYIKNEEFDKIENFYQMQDVNITKKEFVSLYKWLAVNNKEIDYWLSSRTPSKYISEIFNAIKDQSHPEFLKEFISEYVDKLTLDLKTKFNIAGIKENVYSEEELAQLFSEKLIETKDFIFLAAKETYRSKVSIEKLTQEEWSIIAKKEELERSDLEFINLNILKSVNKTNRSSLTSFIYAHPNTTFSDRKKMIEKFEISRSVASKLISTNEEANYFYENIINRPLKDSKEVLIGLLKNKEYLIEEQIENIIEKLLKAKDAIHILTPYIALIDQKTKSKLFTASLKDPEIVLNLLIEGSLDIKERERCLNALFKSDKHFRSYLNEYATKQDLLFISSKIVENNNEDLALSYFYYFKGPERKKIINIFSKLEGNSWKYRDAIEHLDADDIKLIAKGKKLSSLFREYRFSTESLSKISLEKSKIGFYAKVLTEEQSISAEDVDSYSVDLEMFKFYKNNSKNCQSVIQHILKNSELDIEQYLNTEEIVSNLKILKNTNKLLKIDHKEFFRNFSYKDVEDSIMIEYLEYMSEKAPDALMKLNSLDYYNQIFTDFKLDHLKSKFNIKPVNSASELVDLTLLQYLKQNLKIQDLDLEIVDQFLTKYHYKDQCNKQLKESFAEYPELTTEFVLLNNKTPSYEIYSIIKDELSKIGKNDIVSDVLFEYLSQGGVNSRFNEEFIEKNIHLLSEQQRKKVIKQIIDYFKQSGDSDYLVKYLKGTYLYFIDQVPLSLIPVKILTNSDFKEKLLSGTEITEEHVKLYQKYLLLDDSYIVPYETIFRKTVDFVFENKKDVVGITSDANFIVMSFSHNEVAKMNQETGEIEFLYQFKQDNHNQVKKMLEQILRLPEESTGLFDIQTREFEPDIKIPKKYLKKLNISYQDNEGILIDNLKTIKFEGKVKAKVIKNVYLDRNEAYYYNIYLDLHESFKHSVAADVSILLEQKSEIEQFKKEIDKLPVTNRRWGFELEFSSSQSKMKLGTMLNKDGWNNVQVTNSYRSSNGTDWDLKQDSSVKSVLGGFTIEIASPILSGSDGIEQARKFLNFIFENSQVSVGAQTNSGLHIHHEVKDLLKANKTLSVYGKELVKIQEALYSVCADYRQNNSYCSRLSLEGLNDGLELGARDGFNFTENGTLEFRMRESLNDTDAIIRWIKLTQKVVEDLVSVANKNIEEYNSKALETLELLRKEKLTQEVTEKSLTDYLIAEKVSKILIS